jgi:hypothetical protein
VLLENDCLPGDLKARISAFVDYYNTERCHERLNNLTPEDFGFAQLADDRFGGVSISCHDPARLSVKD